MNALLTPQVKLGAIIYAGIGVVMVVVSVIPYLNCLMAPVLCLGSTILPGAIGWMVGTWGNTTNLRDGATQGAIACGLGTIVFGLLQIVINVAKEIMGGTPTLMSVVVGPLGGFVLGIVIFAFFGAVGGLLYVAFIGNKKAKGA